MDPALTKLRRVTMPRWFSVCLILTVFFLPLHFHLTSPIASQVTKECSCLQGTRTQLGIAADVPGLTSLVVLTAVIIQKELTGSKAWSDSQKVRGPPALASL